MFTLQKIAKTRHPIFLTTIFIITTSLLAVIPASTTNSDPSNLKPYDPTQILIASSSIKSSPVKRDNYTATAAPKPKYVNGTYSTGRSPATNGGSCPSNVGGSVSGAPGKVQSGIQGTTTSDLQSFAQQYNALRVANCLYPVAMSNIRYDSCMETRLFWMAEDPSTDPNSAWGHMGSQRSDGVPSVGCDGNLAGGYGNTGSTVATKWWNSSSHRASLYRPQLTGSMGGVCIYFAMTHGGLPNEPASFTRAAAKWGGC